jgi:type IV pilus biogenesis protein CpaD/CtpE
MKGEVTMNMKIALLVMVAAPLAACSGSMRKQTSTEADFGNSVASIRKAQTANPKTLENPSTEAPTGVDPDYANTVLETMRESVSKPAEVKEPIVIQIGGQGQGGH